MTATIVVTAEIRHSTARGLALYQGERHEVVDERTGEVLERDHYVWLPRSQVTIIREWRGGGRDGGGARMAEIAVPEWLARQKELV